MSFAEVIVNNNSANFKDSFSYEIGHEFKDIVKPGIRVIVPFGRSNKKIMGIVVGVKDRLDTNYRLKKIYGVIDQFPIISEPMIDLALWMKDYYLSNYIDSFQLVLPPGDYKELISSVYINQDRDLDSLDHREIEIINYVDEEVEMEDLRTYVKSEGLVNQLKSLFDNEYLLTSVNIKTRVKKQKKAYIKLIGSISYEEGLGKIGKNAKAQMDIYKLLYEKKDMSQEDILKETGRNRSSIKSLEEKGLLEIVMREEERNPIKKEIKDYARHDLNSEQAHAMDYMKSMISTNGDGNVFLLKGVTGSGKTEVYLQMVEETIENNRGVIILVPEIALTPQTVDRFVGRFRNNVAIIHSRLSQGERFDQWRKIKRGDVKIVVGARSAIFAPFKNLGLIIIDEEHETTYKSGQSPKYITYEVAKKRLALEGGNMILGSATPSMETYYESINSDIHLLELKNRVNNRPPTIEVVDMREEINFGNRSIFSKSLKLAIEENLREKKISILFLNRKGFSTFVSCRSCGYVVKCRECDVAMTYYKNINRLKCNYCGRTEVNPTICPECKSPYIKYFGIGTEQVEKMVKDEFPMARVLRMDGDTTREKNSHEASLERVKQGKVDILIGTQMIAKGLDFENVTLVGVVAADTSLNLPDFRASEKTFQLITQVAGRAGRGSYGGKVVIQTYNPEAYSIYHASKENYEEFYKEEIKIRESFLYPPFVEIFSVLIYGENLKKVEEVSIKLYNIIMEEYRQKFSNENIGNFLIGPYPAAFERIKNNYRWQIVIKFEKENFYLLKDIVERVCIYNEFKLDLKDVKISIDRNPLSII